MSPRRAVPRGTARRRTYRGRFHEHAAVLRATSSAVRGSMTTAARSVA
ncbi:hypothetical protein [Nannocystis pusilla]